MPNTYFIGESEHNAPPLEPGLYLVSTPIGNLRDITLRALDVLSACDLIACEDTRASRVLLKKYGIATPCTSYHDHNGAEVRPRLLRKLADGASIALISDAGTPLIADPGFKLVVEAQGHDLPVVAIPGPSAVLTALAASGAPTDRFAFFGFLPPKAAARSRAIKEIATFSGTACLFEAPTRLIATLSSLKDGLGDDLRAVVARELTKRFEEMHSGTLAELVDHFAGHGAPKGEIVIVLHPRKARAATQAEIDAALQAALLTEKVKDASSGVASMFGLSRREVYARALELARARDG
ncbi:MAG: 16S rRNA (cytidine(1402)-2'-O)-methyltransferase [Pseudomonadota bacterium]